ncbi:McrB family protein [Aeromonas jandaei]|uniref:McrB family protein n=1 Tax=Aeromonas jandaei TaxID=650 RepID=UPI002B05C79C|nr:AAA family ATPase [Aeromonas jandaei]
MQVSAEELIKNKLIENNIPFDNVGEHTWCALRKIKHNIVDLIEQVFPPYFSFIASKGLIAYSYSDKPTLYFSEKFNVKAVNSYGGFRVVGSSLEAAYSTRQRIADEQKMFMQVADASGFCKPYNEKKDWYYANLDIASASEISKLNDAWFSSFSEVGNSVVVVTGKVTMPHPNSMEISIRTLDNEKLGFILNDKNEINLSINDICYQAVLRHTDRNKYWISPVCFLDGNELRLIDVLSDAGFDKNDSVEILFSGHDGHIYTENSHSSKPAILRDKAINKIEINKILFGPPGTGKTYNTVTEAIEIIEPGIVEYNSDGRGQLQDKFSKLVKAQRIQFVTFHQSFSYEDFIEGIKAESQDGVLHYRVVDGLFKQICLRAEAAPENPYVLIIDEINRGNISRIFGELITLLEPSKRLGAEEELKVVLPYSKRAFGVPKNLYLIGTMNTADRSLAGLDLALRRRFFFKEMPPRPDLLDSLYVEGIQIGELLRTINRRITALLGRDYCLGHALFMPLKQEPSLLHLGRIFQKQVLPLLQEYFFEDWQKIALVLNDHRKSKGDRFVTQDEDLDLQKLFGEEAELGNLPAGWKIKPEVDVVWSLASAYAGVI